MIAQNRGSIATNYSHQHNVTLLNNAYYRIKAVEADGKISYTGILKLNTRSIKQDIAIVPNPVKGQIINLQLSNMEKGSYNVVIFNAAGIQVYRNTIQHNGGNASMSLSIPSSIQKGNYSIQVRGNNSAITKQLLVAE